MSEEVFTKTLREFIKRRPFLPFVVELTDGKRITIDQPFVSFGGGVAGFISDEDGLVDFSCSEVRSITLVPAEASS